MTTLFHFYYWVGQNNSFVFFHYILWKKSEWTFWPTQYYLPAPSHHPLSLQSGLPASTLSHFSPHPHYSHRDQCSINWPYHSSAQNIPTASHVPKNKIQTYYHCIKESLHSDPRLPYPAILTIVPPPIKSPSPFPCHTLSPFWIFAHNSSLCLVQSLKMASQKFDHRLMFQDDNRNPSCYSQLNLPFLPQCPL